MKRYLMLLAIASLFFAIPAVAVVTYNCDTMTGGATRALDYMSVDDLNDGDRAFVMREVAGTLYINYFKYYATGTTAEQVGGHPYVVRPDDYATGGIWVETAGVYGAFSITDFDVPAQAVSGVSTAGTSGFVLPGADAVLGAAEASGKPLIVQGAVSRRYQIEADADNCYFVKDPIGTGVTLWASWHSGDTIYVYDDRRFIAGSTLWCSGAALAGGGGGIGHQVALSPSWSGVSGWFLSVDGLTGVSWQMLNPANTVVNLDTWIGAE